MASFTAINRMLPALRITDTVVISLRTAGHRPIFKYIQPDYRLVRLDLVIRRCKRFVDYYLTPTNRIILEHPELDGHVSIEAFDHFTTWCNTPDKPNGQPPHICPREWVPPSMLVELTILAYFLHAPDLWGDLQGKLNDQLLDPKWGSTFAMDMEAAWSIYRPGTIERKAIVELFCVYNEYERFPITRLPRDLCSGILEALRTRMSDAHEPIVPPPRGAIDMSYDVWNEWRELRGWAEAQGPRKNAVKILKENFFLRLHD